MVKESGNYADTKSFYYDNCYSLYTPYGITNLNWFIDRSKIINTPSSAIDALPPDNSITDNNVSMNIKIGESATHFGWEGSTSDRPVLSKASGQPYLDTDLGQPIWWNGTDWVDALGNTV